MQIEAPCRRLRDRDTGRSREHDIVITWDRGHHRTLTALECRDRSRPVGVPAVEAFAHKCSATGVHHGVLVSSTGFTQSARAKAESLSIQCMGLEDIASFPWLEMGEVIQYGRLYDAIDLLVILEGEPTDNVGALFDESGNSISLQRLSMIAQSYVPLAPDPEAAVGVTRNFRLSMQTPGWTMKADDGAIHSVSLVEARLQFTGQKQVIPLTLHRYAGNLRGYDFATAEFGTGDFHGRIVMVREENEETSIYIVPNADSKLTLVPSLVDKGSSR